MIKIKLYSTNGLLYLLWSTNRIVCVFASSSIFCYITLYSERDFNSSDNVPEHAF